MSATIKPLTTPTKPPRKRRAIVKPFWGIDGEGCGTDKQGRQNYMLLCAGNHNDHRELYTRKPLTTEQCLEFILSLPADVVLVGFAFGYDATMILRGLEPDRRRDLFLDKSRPTVFKIDGRPVWRAQQRRSPYTYWHGTYGIEYLPGNYLRVCRLKTTRRRSPDDALEWNATVADPGTSRTVYETFGFFQKKFARALDDFAIGSKTERRLIATNKAERAQFVSMTKAVRQYCATECALLAEMMETLRDACHANDIRPRTWNGPGKLAAALHDKHKTITAKALRDSTQSGVLDHAEAAYFGGRFECPKPGQLPPLNEYDINSAYPAQMTKLPCLAHGRWEYLSGDQIKRLHAKNRQALFVADTAYHHLVERGCKGMCGLPHRHSGNEITYGGTAGILCWPVEGRGVYWSPELRSAELLGARLKFGGGWAYRTECDCHPFDWIEPLYSERRRLGKATAGYPLKLAINSLYGKLAQRIGTPRWQNPIWAGLITAMTRAQLNEAIAQNPQAIAMIATDGLYSLEPLDLPLGDGLGQWEMTRHESGLFIVQPGLYWSRDKLKTRGMSKGFFEDAAIRRRFETAWREFATATTERERVGSSAPSVDVPLRLFTGLKLAQARNKPETAGMWVEDTRKLSFSWLAKRGAGRWRDGPYVDTWPVLGGKDWQSAIYSAEADYIMQTALDNAELDDQPDAWQWLGDG